MELACRGVVPGGANDEPGFVFAPLHFAAPGFLSRRSAAQRDEGGRSSRRSKKVDGKGLACRGVVPGGANDEPGFVFAPLHFAAAGFVPRAARNEAWRRGRDSNPRRADRPSTVFKTVALNHSATPPYKSGAFRVMGLRPKRDRVGRPGRPHAETTQPPLLLQTGENHFTAPAGFVVALTFFCAASVGQGLAPNLNPRSVRLCRAYTAGFVIAIPEIGLRARSDIEPIMSGTVEDVNVVHESWAVFRVMPRSAGQTRPRLPLCGITWQDRRLKPLSHPSVQIRRLSRDGPAAQTRPRWPARPASRGNHSATPPCSAIIIQ